MTYEDYLKHFADLINEKRFEDVLSHITKRGYHIRLVEDLFDMSDFMDRYNAHFAEPQFSSDNACGIAILSSICNKE